MKLILMVMAMVSMAFGDVGTVTVVKGDALVQRDVKVLKAYNDMGLLKQDIVETEEGRLQMLFNDSTVISLGRNSRFAIKEYFYGGNSGQVRGSFKLEKGFVKTITGLIGKIKPDAFVLETVFTKVTPHGTIWTSEVNEKSEKYSVIDGRITLSFNDGQERQIDLLAGEAIVLNIGSKDSKRMITSFQKSIQKQENDTYVSNLERNDASVKEDQAINSGTIIIDGHVVDTDSGAAPGFDDRLGDGNNGGGNDPGKVDPSNPGKGNKE